MPSDNIYINYSDLYITLKKELRGESDRGSVVLAVAWIDEYLTDLVKNFLCEPINQQNDQLFKPGGPIGEFGIKIELAYRLGLICKSTYRSLKLFQRTRNEFAHLSSRLTFETPAVKDRLAEIFKINEQIFKAIWEDLLSEKKIRSLLEKESSIHNFEDFINFLRNKAKFDIIAAFTVLILAYTCSNVKRLPLMDGF